MPSGRKPWVKKIKLKCGICDVIFYRYPSVLMTRKKDKHMLSCSRKCADKNKKNAWRLYDENTSQWKGGHASYRQRAIRAMGMKCEKCKYDGTKFPKLIWVHHKDFKPRKFYTDNTIKNLTVLCIRCHLEEHYAIQKPGSKGIYVCKTSRNS